jgi:hypothetical protein
LNASWDIRDWISKRACGRGLASKNLLESKPFYSTKSSPLILNMEVSVHFFLEKSHYKIPKLWGQFQLGPRFFLSQLEPRRRKEFSARSIIWS